MWKKKNQFKRFRKADFKKNFVVGMIIYYLKWIRVLLYFLIKERTFNRKSTININFTA